MSETLQPPTMCPKCGYRSTSDQEAFGQPCYDEWRDQVVFQCRNCFFLYRMRPLDSASVTGRGS